MVAFLVGARFSSSGSLGRFRPHGLHLTTDQEVASSSLAGRATETRAPGAVAQMVSVRGFQRVVGGDAPILVPGLGGCESVAVDFEEVVDGAHESPLT